MDKAPDAFRTISEVADELDIPQHVLRFWETRFSQIKPMKRSGGRRYYRPDDVDLLRGIRRLLYGEGYTIRGVQRILKEQGIKSVQALIDGVPVDARPSPAGTDTPVAQPPRAAGPAPKPGRAPPVVVAPADDDAPDDIADEDIADEDDDDDAPEMIAPMPRSNPVARPQSPQVPPPAVTVAPAVAAPPARKLDTARLEAALQDLLACRKLLDSVMKDAEPIRTGRANPAGTAGSALRPRHIGSATGFEVRTWSEREDLNLRPLVSQTSALTGLRYAPCRSAMIP